MLTILVALAVLATIGFALGRAPLFRALVSLLALLLFGALAGLWNLLLEVTDVARAARRWPDWSQAILAFALPAAVTFLVLGWLRARNRPASFWALSRRPATLSLRGIVRVQALVLLAWILGVNALAAFRERRAERAWEGAPGATPPLAAVTASTSARELARLAAALGIEMPGGKGLGSGSDAAAYGKVREALGSFVFDESVRTDESLSPPTPEVQAWLAATADRLQAVERHLRAGDPVAWELDPESWHGFPIRGLRDLHTVLVAAAFERIRAGRTAEAGGALEAAWRLTDSFRDRPSTLPRLVALVHDRALLGALRQIGPPSAEWPPRLDAIHDAARHFAGIKPDALGFLQGARKPETTVRGVFLETDWAIRLFDGPSGTADRVFLALTGGPVGTENYTEAIEGERARARGGFYRFLQGPLERPYLRLCGADYAAVLQRELADALARDACVSLPASAPPPRRLLARWNVVGHGSASFVPRMARTVAAVRAQVELTRLVLRARALRAESPQRAWPTELADLGSSACPGRHWVYGRAADGATIRLDSNPFAEKEAPVEFRMSR
jgi:hypothetical protein